MQRKLLYNRNMKITTKTGDRGETSLFGGRRVSKASAFIALVGELDELQAVVGWSQLSIRERRVADLRGITKILDRVVDDLYRMMAIVGFEMKCPKNIRLIDEKDVEFLEKEIEARQGVVKNLSKFIRPGTTEMAARLHIARTVCRRVERGLVNCQLSIVNEQLRKGGASVKRDKDPRACAYNVRTKSGEGVSVPENVKFMLKYLNRLSDLLFILAYEREKN